MKSKWHSLLLVGSVLILANSVVACGQATTSPSPTQQALTTQPAIQPTPRILTTTGVNLTIPLKSDERVEITVGPLNLIGWQEAKIGTFVTINASVKDPNGNVIKTSSAVLRPKYHENQTTMNTFSFTFIAPVKGDYKLLTSAKGVPSRPLNYDTPYWDIKAVIYP